MLIADLAAWLVEESERRGELSSLFEGFCTRLDAAGLGLWRTTLGLETLHPELSGIMLRWHPQAGMLEPRKTPRAGVLASESYLRSPVKVVDDTGRPFRWRAGEPMLGMPLLAELAGEGVTDYVMLPLPFLDGSRTAVMSFATRAPGGFTAEHYRTLAQAARLFSPWAERVLLRKIALGLLEAYVGPAAGRRVYDGQIERGDVETITAAILCCDLRGFTALSDRLPRREVVGLLNRWFEVTGAAIEGEGGEILKFMGDGLLAVFPIEGEPAATCGRALLAAEAALAGTAALDPELVAAGHHTLRFGVGLHRGDVELGNIGTRTRLDFTVIGPAVNMASRLESLTKELGEPVVASAAFAAAVGRRMRPLGSYRLRGIAEPVAVFGLEGPAFA
ncbi:adenylate/guanylate cyclase domain-containing protein [Benzoatithermus flavus]|uniref:Adenylate/guanylate cyclase domain-containing protein n=1 Tax=Benzoatithermus flavus TaxID=3108223 RepID=A0ABU8XPM1_9PROT